MWYVFGLVWIAVMVAIVLRYTRKHRHRASERAQQMESMLVELKANPRAFADVEPVPAQTAATVVPQFTRKPRLLTPQAALLYYVFRTGLPDHEIFAGVALDEVLEVDAAQAQGGTTEQVRRKLAQQRRLDLVICTKQLEVVAAVLVGTASAGENAENFTRQCLQSAGVRVIQVDPAAPPRHQQVHALVYG
jgi:hypothetical protein